MTCPCKTVLDSPWSNYINYYDNVSLLYSVQLNLLNFSVALPFDFDLKMTVWIVTAGVEYKGSPA